MKVIWRYEIPIDDQAHEFTLTDYPRHFAVKRHGMMDYSMEFWAEHDSEEEAENMKFLVVGTGHKIPDNAFYIGTAPRFENGLVFHLTEIMDNDGS